MKASGSRLPLLVRCGYSMRPDVTLPPSTDSEASIRGVARHRDFERWALGNRHPMAAAAGSEWDSDYAEERYMLDTYEADPLSAWPDVEAARLRFLLELSTRLHSRTSSATEIVMVYDVLTGRVRCSNHRRTHEDPIAKPSEIRLICDVAQGDLVIDYKTGRPIEGAGVQTRALALAWARLHGLDSVRAALAYVDDAGRWWRYDEERLDVFDLAETAEMLRDLYDHEAEHVPRPGPWCRELYCPLAGSCPATRPALVHAVGGTMVPTLDPQTEEEAAALWQARNALRKWESDAHAALRRYVDAGRTIPIGNGRRWGRVESKGPERVSLTAAGVEYLRGELPDALVVSTTKTEIEHCASRERARKVIAKLGEMGCLSSKPSVKYEEIEE